jgi:uncharacterized membrane protein
MSLREKGAWASLIATAVVFVPYFRYVFRLFAAGELQPVRVLAAFVGAAVYLTVLMIAVGIAIELLSRREPQDERDVAIEAKSYRIAYTVLSTTGMLAIVAIIFLGIVPAPKLRNEVLAPQFLSQVLLLCFVVAEAVRAVTQIVFYRRGS